MYTTLAIMPVGYIAYLGICGRFRTDTFEFSGCTPIQQKAFNAYREPVALVERTLSGRTPRQLSTQTLERVVAVWEQGRKSGVLKPLYPATIDQQEREGPLSEVSQALTRVVDLENELARRERKRGNYAGSVAWLCTAYNTILTMKYSNESSVSLGASIQRMALADIRRMEPKLTNASRLKLETKLQEMLASMEPVSGVVERAYHVAKDYKHNRSEVKLTSDEPGSIVAYASSRDRTSESQRDLDEIAQQSEFVLADHADSSLKKELTTFLAQVQKSNSESAKGWNGRSPAEARKIAGPALQ